MGEFTVLIGDALDRLKDIPDLSVDTCITSPPYWGLREYGGNAKEIGREPDADDFIGNLLQILNEVKRVLKDTGTLWLNIGDTYHNKQLQMIPARIALSLQAAGWILRQDIIWAKPNPMPEPAFDRCVRAHEYLFLLAKQKSYYFDYEAIEEPMATGMDRLRGPSMTNTQSTYGSQSGGNMGLANMKQQVIDGKNMRRKRSVWPVSPMAFKGAHFAVFPPELIEPCVLAGSPVGGMVLDPFAGSGTTLGVAVKHGRNAIGIELNMEYAGLIPDRVSQIVGHLVEAGEQVPHNPTFGEWFV